LDPDAVMFLNPDPWPPSEEKYAEISSLKSYMDMFYGSLNFLVSESKNGDF
jgi:hypothetical protein